MILYHFGDEEMFVSEGRYLWHVGDRDDLVTLSQVGHFLADGSGDFASDVCVDFVENHEGDLVLIGECAFDGKHDAGHFTTGGDDSQGLERFARVGSEEKVDGFVSARAVILEFFELDFEDGLVEAEIAKVCGDFFGE